MKSVSRDVNTRAEIIFSIARSEFIGIIINVYAAFLLQDFQNCTWRTSSTMTWRCVGLTCVFFFFRQKFAPNFQNVFSSLAPFLSSNIVTLWMLIFFFLSKASGDCHEYLATVWWVKYDDDARKSVILLLRKSSYYNEASNTMTVIRLPSIRSLGSDFSTCNSWIMFFFLGR